MGGEPAVEDPHGGGDGDGGSHTEVYPGGFTYPDRDEPGQRDGPGDGEVEFAGDHDDRETGCDQSQDGEGLQKRVEIAGIEEIGRAHV